ncbi:MaoC/PaaZ C-terminal domain-containing protein [Syntrophomonas palmitatica]|uniref:MaoC/PaaZ C-terminal domain-containing protein n=1 Tax=Syntrophomonas palmitatica TaxID=402877 RepID=UPI0006D01749|nr:MaoC/PaaZ C-terminal domain-containing protein [Syntrophomonas palmitatica]
MPKKYYKNQFTPSGKRLEVVENYGHPGTTAYKIQFFRTMGRGILRRHRVVFKHPRYGRDVKFKLYKQSQRKWYKLFQVPDDVIVPFTYFDYSRALGFMKVISGLGVNFTNILHLKSEMWFYKPLVAGERYVIDYVFEDVVKVKRDKAAIVSYSAINRNGELYQEVRDHFIIKNVEEKYLSRLHTDEMNQFKGITRLPAEPIEDVKIKEIYIPLDLPVKYTSTSGDYSFIHITPRAARFFGFGKPFLQGLCTANLLLKELVMAGIKLEYFSIVFCLPVYLDNTVYLHYNDREYRLQDAEGRVLAFGLLHNDHKPRLNSSF